MNKKQNHNIDGLLLGHGWNRGLKRTWESPTEFKKGQTPWNKGIKTFDEQKYKREYIRNKRKTDLIFKLKDSLRHRIYLALKGISKSKRTMELLGCSIEQLKQHLKIKFTKGMSFKNYGKWHIDHVVPCASFDLSNPEEQHKCFNFKNLQPLWAKDNLEKRDKISNTLIEDK